LHNLMWDALHHVMWFGKTTNNVGILKNLLSVSGCAAHFTTTDAINATIAKNDAKTPDTHYLDKHGKVTRR